MKSKILWQGKTKVSSTAELTARYLEKINRMVPCQVIETREAKGISEKDSDKIKKIEANGIEKHLKDDYIICLFHKGKQMNSKQFASFLQKLAFESTRTVTFVVGGFIGLEDRLLKRADLLLSMSRMTFSHELSRLMLLEQIYRAFSFIEGLNYAK